LGRPGGAPGGINLVPVGVLGADSGVGTRFDRTRITVLLGGDVLRSIADAERAGGGPDSVALEGLGPVIPGDAVCALEGALDGGGGAVALAVSTLTDFLFTQRFRSLS